MNSHYRFELLDSGSGYPDSAFTSFFGSAVSFVLILANAWNCDGRHYGIRFPTLEQLFGLAFVLAIFIPASVALTKYKVLGWKSALPLLIHLFVLIVPRKIGLISLVHRLGHAV